MKATLAKGWLDVVNIDEMLEREVALPNAGNHPAPTERAKVVPPHIIDDKPVIGIQACNLFAAQNLKEEAGNLQAGVEVSVEEEQDWAVRVATADGKKGWVRRCCLCTTQEFQRRKRAGEVPTSMICIGADKDRGTYLYGGDLPIRMGKFAVDAGQAFWMDPTARGETFTVGSHHMQGDPSILFLYTKDDRMVNLHIWAGVRKPTPNVSERDGSPKADEGQLREKEKQALSLLGTTRDVVTVEGSGSAKDVADLFDLSERLAKSKEKIAFWLPQMKYSPSNQKVSRLLMLTSANPTIASIRRILGEEDQREKESIKILEKMDVTWHKYRWLHFGVVDGVVKVLRAELAAKVDGPRNSESSVSQAPKSPLAKKGQNLLPKYKGELSGTNEVRIVNPNKFKVWVGLRSAGKGKNFSVAPGGRLSVYVPNGNYEIYFV